MIKTEVNVQALDAAVKLLWGDRASELTHNAYQALDVAMKAGYDRAVAERVSPDQDGWDAGYDAGYEEADRQAGRGPVEAEEDQSLYNELTDFLMVVAGMNAEDADKYADAFVDHWVAIHKQDVKT